MPLNQLNCTLAYIFDSYYSRLKKWGKSRLKTNWHVKCFVSYYIRIWCFVFPSWSSLKPLKIVFSGWKSLIKTKGGIFWSKNVSVGDKTKFCLIKLTLFVLFFSQRLSPFVKSFHQIKPFTSLSLKRMLLLMLSILLLCCCIYNLLCKMRLEWNLPQFFVGRWWG